MSRTRARMRDMGALRVQKAAQVMMAAATHARRSTPSTMNPSEWRSAAALTRTAPVLVALRSSFTDQCLSARELAGRASQEQVKDRCARSAQGPTQSCGTDRDGPRPRARYSQACLPPQRPSCRTAGIEGWLLAPETSSLLWQGEVPQHRSEE